MSGGEPSTRSTRAGLLLALSAGLLLAITAYGVRYEPPPLGRLVVNAVMEPSDAPTLTLPLRLPRTGRYYAELILEPPADGGVFALDRARKLTFEATFQRRQRQLQAFASEVSFAPGDRSKTLFWLDVPTMLPDRAALSMWVVVKAGAPDALTQAQLRLQLTRKMEMLPFGPR